MPIYKRILLKLSGESLMGTQKYGLSTEVLGSYAEQIAAIAAEGVQIGIVIGGGNIFPVKGLLEGVVLYFPSEQILELHIPHFYICRLAHHSVCTWRCICYHIRYLSLRKAKRGCIVGS